MTETRGVSIDEVRALVAERQRYDDWLTALESRRTETPERVFVRVQGDYAARRRDVLSRLREHVSGLVAMTESLDARLASLESRLGALEDERAEAMLRTAVGEFDDDRWEQVRQAVETQIAELGEERTTLLAEVEEVRTLLTNARSEPDEAEASAPLGTSDVAPDAMTDSAETHAVEETASMPEATIAIPSAELAATLDEPLLDVLIAAPDEHQPSAPRASVDELADLDSSLALFSTDATIDPFDSGTMSAVSAPSATSPVSVSPSASSSLDGLDVFDDAELGDLRMSPPVRSTATATPPGSPHQDALVNENTSPVGHAAVPARDGFDDLAFLRSVVEPTGQGGTVRASSTGEQQKTLRCTECGTMNFPTEWYCERCGGELAAF